MDDTTAPPRLTRLTFHGPLSEDRAARMIRRLSAQATPVTVLDIGCGWGEFMLRLLEATPGATGVGIDLNEDDLARGRANAEARGLAERVRFVQESAVDTAHGPADLVLCFSASHALSDAQPPEHTTAALRALRRLVTPGGRVLLGESFWQRTPTPSDLSAMWPDASPAEFHDLPDLVDLAIAAGFRPAWIETANLDEWDDFESAYQSDVEEWLAAHPDHPVAKETRNRVDRHRAMWLRGYRGVMGLAYLTLVPVS
ncbi:SAM-dependent methyltransferase [Kitasatospora sp. GAS204A]|uniref:SAM-dependent methyltransferase n=1 Tax=unclassified Kitasatospora TaxID=2633591 RepID=UPI002476C212|nr:class I SAM-dependent methyltransferase [Kitasatospora sp. GAS204B]MDH6120012.1 SAM-dependent methyltransferase [Kitasatospora sp. GAS204B]